MARELKNESNPLLPKEEQEQFWAQTIGGLLLVQGQITEKGPYPKLWYTDPAQD